MAERSHGPKGLYPNCDQHLTAAGLRKSEAAAEAGISTSSISRMQKKQPVLLTTISKLINALNRKHFQSQGKPIDFDAEVERQD